VIELGVSGAQATIVYSGPDCSSSVYSCPVSAGERGSRQAAELALSEAVSFPLESAAFDVVHVMTDRKGGVGPDGSPRPAQIHHLAAADTDFSANELCACIQAAGLVPLELMPGPAAMLRSASNLAIAKATGAVTSLVIWIGEQGAVLACASPQRLAFVRSIAVGTETLVEAISRPAPGKMTATTSAVLDRAAARELLFTQGIPHSQDAHGHPQESENAHLFPLMRPVLQRLAIELKQSLRFGLMPDERAGLRVFAAGPGIAIRNLTQVLSWDAGIDNPIEKIENAETLPEELRGEASAAMIAKSGGVSLLPRAVKTVAWVRRTRRALWVGIAAAALAIGIDGLQTRIAVLEQRDILSRLEARAAQPDPTRDALQRVVLARQGVSMAKVRIQQRLARSPEASAVLAMLAAQTPQNVRLRSIQLSLESGEWKSRITGVARSGANTPPAQLVKQFIDQLESAPLVTHAHLGPTQLAQGATEQTLSFDISMGIVCLPRDGASVYTSAAAPLTEQTGDRP